MDIKKDVEATFLEAACGGNRNEPLSSLDRGLFFKSYLGCKQEKEMACEGKENKARVGKKMDWENWELSKKAKERCRVLRLWAEESMKSSAIVMGPQVVIGEKKDDDNRSEDSSG